MSGAGARFGGPEGVSGRVLAYDGKLLVAEGPRAFAPGEPVRIEVGAGFDEAALAGSASATLDARCLGSRRLEGGRYALRFRLVSLRRADRELLVALLADEGVAPGR